MVRGMKHRAVFAAVIVLLSSCAHDISTQVSFNVSLSSDNTFVAGEPVTFNFDGDVDNIVFYSGEIGSEYQFKDRYSVPVDDVKAARLNLEYMPQYGTAGAMEVWISTDFPGLDGEDGEADRATIKGMVETMKGWKRLDYAEGKSAEWTEQSYLLTDSLKAKKNFCLAFHWNPDRYRETGGDRKYLAQRTYWIKGNIELDINHVNSLPLSLTELSFKTVMMNKQVDAYHHNAGNGSIILNSSSADLIFQGVGQKDSLNYAIDAWAISTPVDLNSVANDKGVVIKNQQNYLKSYDYVWSEPGTYKVVFVGTNSNYKCSSGMVQELTVTILENVAKVL